MKMPERPSSVTWNYYEGADVLYVSAESPRPAVGIDIGAGLVLRDDETQHEVVGLTVIGLRNRLVRNLDSSAEESSADQPS